MSGCAIATGDAHPGVRRGKLVVISRTEWSILMNLYERDWPQHAVNYYTLKIYIEWGVKNPEMNDVHIYSTDQSWRVHGTYLLEDRNLLRYNVLFDTLSDPDLVLSALKCLETTPAYTLTTYVENMRPVTLQHLRGLGVTDLERGYCFTLLYYLPMEKCLNLELQALPGLVLKLLTLKHIDEIDNLWPHQHPGSAYLIERLIRYNLTYGAFTESEDHLCGWVMLTEVGTIGLLQVKANYRRRGIGEALLRLLARRLAETRGMAALATVMVTNKPSRYLFEKLDFQIIDHVYWFDKPAMDTNRNLLRSE